jgi:siroheme synthase (precorrin-2 oxidase/ferrochelatase)
LKRSRRRVRRALSLKSKRRRIFRGITKSPILEEEEEEKEEEAEEEAEAETEETPLENRR